MRSKDSHRVDNDLKAFSTLEIASRTLASFACSRSRRAFESSYANVVASRTSERRRRSRRSSTTSTLTHSLSSRKHRRALRAHSSRIAYDRFVRLDSDLESRDDNSIASRCLINIDATTNS